MIKHYSDIKFDKSNDGFKHNLEADFACFALWKPARPYRDTLRKLLSSRFEILLETEIEWSDKHFHDNAERLYEEPIFNTIPKEKRKSNFAEKIGDNTFVLFVIKDVSPRYTFAQSVSLKIELSNLNTVEVKREIRKLIEKDLDIQYGVHSTNSIYEFFVQAPLLLGIDRFEKLLKGERLQCDKIVKDLEGADGWQNWEAVFKILNLTSNYLVLRGFETLPQENPDKDIDLLTDNYQRLASALGVQQSPKKPYKGFLSVNNEPIEIDIRFVGDKYYDPNWEQDLLESKEYRNGVFVPREDLYFFSLLFHAKAQKSTVKKRYIGILKTIAENLSFDWFQADLLANDKAMGKILAGYLQSQGYYYEDPIDLGVYKNLNVIKYFPKTPISKKSQGEKLKGFIKKTLPDPMVTLIKKSLKK